MDELTSDIVVVGGGGAALATAITAAERGSSVILIEKAPKLGGSTAVSIGSVSAAGTRLQRDAGIEDTADEHLADMPAWAGSLVARDNPKLWGLMTANGADTMKWLEESGLDFVGPFHEPPHSKPRMHNVLPNSRAFEYHLSRRAQRAGVRVFTDTAAKSLIVENGRVIGVRAVSQGFHKTFTATRGVVLAAGDFSASPDFKRRLGRLDQLDIPAMNPHATGDAHLMAMDLGAHIVNSDIAFPDIRFRFLPPAKSSWLLRLPPLKVVTTAMKMAMRYLPKAVNRPFVMKFLTAAMAPDAALFASPGTLLLNRKGQAVQIDKGRVGEAIAAQEGKLAYLLLGGETVKKFNAWPHFLSTAPGIAYAYVDDYLRTRPDICFKAATLEAVAAATGFDLASLRTATLGVVDGPFVVMGPLHAHTILADGGLAISENFEVLNAANRPIPGLYAVGSTGQSGLLLRGHGHHLAWAFTSGRLAGAMLSA